MYSNTVLPTQRGGESGFMISFKSPYIATFSVNRTHEYRLGFKVSQWYNHLKASTQKASVMAHQAVAVKGHGASIESCGPQRYILIVA